MNRSVVRVACALASFAFGTTALAQGSLVIYPAKNQTAEQQSKDEAECQTWAKKNTGIDPLALANTASQPAPVSAPPPPQGERVRGAARGAAAGAAIGAVAGDAGKGAAAGAAAGTVAGGARKREAARQQQAQTQQQAQAQSSNVQAQLATFNKAYAACLEGRGYTVK